MTIEFECSECGRAMRAPDGAAGKQGKCPQCGTVMVIPAPEPPTPAAVLTADGKLEFPCPSCARTVRTPAAAAGKRGKCPQCGDILQIPELESAAPSESSESPAEPPPESRAAAEEEERTTGAADVVEFQCPTCQNKMRAPATAAGRNGKCPRCQSTVPIPAPVAAPARGGAAAKGTATKGTPKPSAAAEPKPAAAPKKVLKLSGLRRIGAPAAAPTPAAPEGLAPIGGLTPLSAPAPLDGLAPLGGAPGGLTPLDSTGGLTPLGAPGGFSAPGFSPAPGFAAAPTGGGPAAGGFAPAPSGSFGGAPGGGYGVAPAPRSGGIDIGSAFPLAWNLFTSNFGSAFLLGIIMTVFSGAVSFATWMLMGFAGALESVELRLVILALCVLLILAATSYFFTGLQYACVRAVRVGRLDASDFLKATEYSLSTLSVQFFVTLLAAAISFAPILVGWTLGALGMAKFGALITIACMVVAGIVNVIVVLKFSQAQFFILDRRMSVFAAMKASFQRMTAGNCAMYFLAMLLTTIGTSLVGSLTCCIGTTVAYPFITLVMAVLYVQVSD